MRRHPEKRHDRIAVSDEEQDCKTEDCYIINLLKHAVEFAYVQMYEENAEPYAEIQSKKQYVQAESGDDEGEGLSVI